MRGCFAALAMTFLLAMTDSVSALAANPERVVLETDVGSITLVLFPEVAPKTVKQFMKMVRLGIYDTTHFHRVHPGFVAQVSEAADRERPLTPEQTRAIQNIPAEFSKLRHQKGVLSMARWDDDINSARMSFSILLGDAPHLDGKYTIFGMVEGGLEALEEIQRLPRRDTTPLERIRIHRAIVAETPEQLAEILAKAPARRLASMDVSSNGFLICVIFWIGLVSLIVALSGKKLSHRTLLSFHFSHVLAAVFALVVALGPITRAYPFLGGFLILMLLGSFRLFSRFESP